MTPDEMMKEGDKLYNQGSPGGAREWYSGAFGKLKIMTDHRIEALEEWNTALEEKLERAINAGTQISAELERVKAQVPRWVRVEDFKADESKLQFAWMAHKGRAYITMVKPHPELDGFAIVTHEADYTDMPDGYIALIPAPLPASSGPEQTKCKTCNDTGMDLLSVWNTAQVQPCPDCAKDRAEPQEAEARRAYIKWTDNQGIHCNRFPGWMELSEVEREEWRRKVCHTPRPSSERGEQ